MDGVGANLGLGVFDIVEGGEGMAWGRGRGVFDIVEVGRHARLGSGLALALEI